MLEYIVVFLVVGIAVYFSAKKLIVQLKGRGCDGCSCQIDSKKFEKIIKSNQRGMKNSI